MQRDPSASYDLSRPVPSDAVSTDHPTAGLVIQLLGEHDAFTASAVADAIGRLVHEHRSDVVIDLGGAEFIDASTIRVLEQTRFALDLHGRTLTLRSPSPLARRVLEICELAALVDTGGWATAQLADGNRGSSFAIRADPSGRAFVHRL